MASSSSKNVEEAIFTAPVMSSHVKSLSGKWKCSILRSIIYLDVKTQVIVVNLGIIQFDDKQEITRVLYQR